MALSYGALAETLMFPILVGAAWGGGFGALATSLAALVLVSPIAIHEVIGLGESVSHASSWAFQGAVFAAFAGTSGLLFSESDRQSEGEERSMSADAGFEGYHRVLASLANTVEVRDHHTQGHCERVARNALIMGHALGISSRETSVLYWAARLHDLGKIAVPEYILLKSGRLTEEGSLRFVGILRTEQTYLPRFPSTFVLSQMWSVLTMNGGMALVTRWATRGNRFHVLRESLQSLTSLRLSRVSDHIGARCPPRRHCST